MNTFDIDGVIYMGPGRTGVFPGPNDLIITGRSFEETDVTFKMLSEMGITNRVFFNPLRWEEKTRESSGHHKSRVINFLLDEGHDIQLHFEDDPVQADIIRRRCPRIEVVLLQHDLVEKENVWHE